MKKLAYVVGFVVVVVVGAVLVGSKQLDKVLSSKCR